VVAVVGGTVAVVVGATVVVLVGAVVVAVDGPAAAARDALCGLFDSPHAARARHATVRSTRGRRRIHARR
jgi:hypothetical protein